MTNSSTTVNANTGARPAVALAAEDISKTYGATRALDRVSLEVSAGSIHGLMGGNGSGKSTFIKTLAGVLTPDHGRLALGGEWFDAQAHTPARAKESGLHFVHQQNSTFRDLTVAENLALGRGFESTPIRSIAWRSQRIRALEVLERFELDIPPDLPMAQLSAAAQMMVAIARALQDQDETTERGVLVLDEPTASLPRHEVDLLLTALRRYAANGQTIIYVSHRLGEVTAIADEVTVLRNGQVASKLFGAEITHDSLVEEITGSAVDCSSDSAMAAARLTSTAQDTPETGVGSPVLTFRRSVMTRDEPTDALVLRAGEIVGVAGLLGSGRTRLLKQIFGAAPRDGFEVLMAGRASEPPHVRTAIARGIGLVPEDRLGEAAFPELSIAENLSITCLGEHSSAGWIKPSRERGAAKRLIQEFGVRAASAAAPLTSLSGGNQQKVMLARWLQRRPEVLLLDEPTQGVDIGARNEIHELVRTAAAAGTAVLVVASEFVELAALAHRAVVVKGGQVVGSVEGPLTEDILNDVVYAQERVP